MDDRLFIETEEKEQGKEFEEAAEEDYEYLDYDYDDFDKIKLQITKPEVTTWAGPGCDGTTSEGLLVDWPILGRSKNISVFNDVCPICFKALTGSGKHQICCLPCGHIYGRSCINQWLQQSEIHRKCPQCKSLCTLKDVTLLYATCPCDAGDDLPKVSTKRFPFTKQGFKAFKRLALRRLDDESGMWLMQCDDWLDAMRRRDYIWRQRKDIIRRSYYSDVVQPEKYWRIADKLLSRQHSLERRMLALRRRINAYHESIKIFCAKVQRAYATRQE